MAGVREFATAAGLITQFAVVASLAFSEAAVVSHGAQGATLAWGLFSSSSSIGPTTAAMISSHPPGSTSSLLCLEQVEPWCAIPFSPSLGPAPTLDDAHPSDTHTSNTASTVSLAIDLLSKSSSRRSSSSSTNHSPPHNHIPAGLKQSLDLDSEPDAEQHPHKQHNDHNSSSMHETNSGSSMLCSFLAPLPAALATTRRSAATVHDLVGSPPPVAPLKCLKISTEVLLAGRPAPHASSASRQHPAGTATSTAPATPKRAPTPSQSVCPPAPKRHAPTVVLVPLSELGSYAHRA